MSSLLATAARAGWRARRAPRSPSARPIGGEECGRRRRRRRRLAPLASSPRRPPLVSALCPRPTGCAVRRGRIRRRRRQSAITCLWCPGRTAVCGNLFAPPPHLGQRIQRRRRRAQQDRQKLAARVIVAAASVILPPRGERTNERTCPRNCDGDRGGDCRGRAR